MYHVHTKGGRGEIRHLFRRKSNKGKGKRAHHLTVSHPVACREKKGREGSHRERKEKGEKKKKK